MPGCRSSRAPKSHASAPSRHPQRKNGFIPGAMTVLTFALTGLVSCAGWELRRESAILMSPADEVWNEALELLREREFKIGQQDNTKHELQAKRDIVLRVVSGDRSSRPTEDKERHQIDLSVRTQGDDRSVIELLYRIDSLVVEDQAFRFIGAVRDRLAIRASGTGSGPFRRR